MTQVEQGILILLEENICFFFQNCFMGNFKMFVFILFQNRENNSNLWNFPQNGKSTSFPT